jgi:biopolymer transport protein TolR
MRKGRNKPLSEINVTNLVDVTLVLLIIFMITAPLLQRGIQVQLPKAQAENIKKQDAIVITLTKEGQFFINNDPVADAGFDRILRSVYETSGKPSVLLRADTEIPYGRVIAFMDRIKKAGIGNLGLVVESGEAP